MGYSTYFKGKLKLNRNLTVEDYNALKDIANKDWRDDRTRPDVDSYYCQWTPTEDGWFIEWDGGEKFYGYIEWLKWLIEKFFVPKGYILNGTIKWEGEDNHDVGLIEVKDNTVTIKEGKIILVSIPS